jgi:probable rRNA maturation factor
MARRKLNHPRSGLRPPPPQGGDTSGPAKPDPRCPLGDTGSCVAGRTTRGGATELSLSLQFADAAHRDLLPRHRVARWLRAALQRPAQLTVRIVGEAEGRALNRDYRGKDYATNVLTFDYEHAPTVVADLILCAPVVAREAREQHKELAAHYAHMLVHGALHAQGYDHEADDEAAAMEARESEVMRGLGFADPYRA